MIYFIGVMCAYFTFMVIWKPHFAWSILSGISWMLLMWYVLTNHLFTAGDFGENVFIGVCILATTFVLLYTINDERQKRRVAREAEESKRVRSGVNESADQYYDRLDKTVKSQRNR